MSNSTSITSKSFTAGRARRVTLATLLYVLGTAPTWAAPTSMTVSFRDLDLSSIAGATTLYHRIQSAAKQVCGFGPGTDLIQRAVWQACYRDTTADAVRKVNNPLLTALHTGRSSSAVTAMSSK
jgi:UrcA family protein